MKYIFMKTSKDVKSAQNDITVYKSSQIHFFLIVTKISKNSSSTTL